MESAQLFIRKIPANTTLTELREFINSGISWMGRLRWGRKYRIVDVKILTVIDKATRDIEFHGLITIQPKTLADQIIKRLHLKHFKGRRVAVRHFYKRSWLNDRRQNQDESPTSLPYPDQRCKDRRRRQVEIIDDTTIKTTSLDTFSRRLV